MDSDEEYTYEDHEDEEQEEEEYTYSDGEKEASVPQASMAPDGYKIISSDDLRSTMDGVVSEISGLLDLDKYAAAALLRCFMWNKEKVIDAYCSEPEETKKKAGIAHFTLDFKRTTASVPCDICRDPSDSSELIALGCEHYFHRSCFTEYLVKKIEEGTGCIFTTCPGYPCKEVVTENFFQKLVPPDQLAIYQRFSLKSFVDICSSLRWCPGRNCDKVAMAGSSIPQVLCKCGMLFCFRCGEEAHVPATCDDIISWGEKCRNESETANWILANTKKCPKCMTRIEKNQGCNHMSCRQCKFEFCWICMGPWTDHGANTGGYYKCNKYDPNRPTKDDLDGAKAKAELDRYLHYYQRYHNHHKSQQYAERQQEETDRRMIQLQESDGSPWIDVQFLKNAMEQLIECRRVLKYTYVFGYYLPEGSARKRLFEDHQEKLEKFTEHLSELSELNLEELGGDKRSEVVNYTRVTERFLKNLLRSVEEGLDEAGEEEMKRS